MSIEGRADPRFSAAREAFEQLFDDGLETGAAFAVEVDGQSVVDLWGGLADGKTGREWRADTLVPVFSTTKALTALVVARLVEEGALDYDQTVASLWPDFAAEGKGAVTVAETLSHQAGLPGFPDEMDPADWFDWDKITGKLAAMAPMWPPGTASGYHPVTFGFLAGEIVRRASGKSVGRILREDFAEPFDLDVWIGLPDEEHERAAELERPKAFADFGTVTPAKRAAFFEPWSSPGRRGAANWRRAEFAGANGHATARGLAAMLSFIAAHGARDGQVLFSEDTLEQLTRERVRGQNLILPFEMSFSAGLIRNLPGAEGWGIWGPSPAAAGHSGWGGSCAFADPERGLSFAYAMNRQSPHLIGDPRPARLIEAVYSAF